MGPGLKLALAAGVAAAATAATAQPPQKVTGPVAVYWMSAATQSGFGMPGMGGGGGRPSMGAMMGAMMGGAGGGATKSLTLQLGSSQTNAAPSAEHLPPQGLGAGPSLPLLTPHIEPSKPAPVEHEEVPREYQRPKGKMLIFWGCGQHARPGQPLVIDFAQMDPAKMKAGQIPAGLAALRGFDYRHMDPPSPWRNKTYGDWPNEKARTQIPSNGSLVGDHTIQGNYSPTIKLKLDEDQDFLGPLNLTTNAKQPGGWATLGWNLVGNAQAYLATAVGGGNDTVVMWTSSDLQSAAFAMPDYLSNSEITRLVANRALMGPATKTCDVPKEVLDAMPQGLVQMVAYGGEQNFAYPPRPQDPKVPWNIQWEVKVRYRSATGGLLGMEMPGAMGGRGGYPGGAPPSRGGQPQQPQQPPQRPSAADILKKGILGGALPFPH
ncbi:MAG: hypothetical protein JF588_16525 [Caulobacterales bacterium]|nr:hypothetical protein [Caulobacterales bacterium]